MKKVYKFISLIVVLTLITSISAFFSACGKDKKIKVYNTETKQIETMNLESYIEGVVGGEIDNNSPIEALKAQAVLARTFTLKFINDSKSKYEGADISTDINEAQAYNKDNINDNIKKAVKETKGKTIKYEGDYINAWFHSNSGGKTATALEGLNVNENLGYIKSVETNETSDNSKNYSFTAEIGKDKILNALRDIGVSVSSISSFKKGELGQSGRCLSFIIGSKEVNANTFRMAVGSTLLKSTLIDSITVNQNSVTFKGRGYGHGVGLSQEYAIELAKEGKNYKEIINYFFKDVSIS